MLIRRVTLGLQRWLSQYECLLHLEKTGILFTPLLSDGPQLPVNLATGGTMLYSGLMYTHIDMHPHS